MGGGKKETRSQKDPSWNFYYCPYILRTGEECNRRCYDPKGCKVHRNSPKQYPCIQPGCDKKTSSGYDAWASAGLVHLYYTLWTLFVLMLLPPFSYHYYCMRIGRQLAIQNLRTISEIFCYPDWKPNGFRICLCQSEILFFQIGKLMFTERITFKKANWFP